ERFDIIDTDTPENHRELLQVSDFSVGGLDFKVFEGSGGHTYGEMIFISEKSGVIFTGDILVNISGFSAERAEFNSLAPYLMRSVNIDSRKATEMRNQVVRMAEKAAAYNRKPCIICGGHGPISTVKNGILVNCEFTKEVTL
ncbi:MAG TPA: MBL fold metallo-hydrolase, partial [Ruminiclostridium sp.]|nr:MBL fold metallo-hydrolase [Ruminiclostridium sp.]